MYTGNRVLLRYKKAINTTEPQTGSSNGWGRPPTTEAKPRSLALEHQSKTLRIASQVILPDSDLDGHSCAASTTALALHHASVGTSVAPHIAITPTRAHAGLIACATT